jgi:hypothetical protein
MCVDPKFTKYTINSGSEATVGKMSLWRQRKLSTSSANPAKEREALGVAVFVPRKIMHVMLNRALKNSASLSATSPGIGIS